MIILNCTLNFKGVGLETRAQVSVAADGEEAGGRASGLGLLRDMLPDAHQEPGDAEAKVVDLVELVEGAMR